MPRFAGFRLCIALALVAIAGGRQSARAGFITDVTVSTAPVSGGLTQYDYTVSDASGSTITASFFFLAVDTTANLSAMTAPTGWDISYATGDTVIEFSSSDPSHDITSGSIGLFSVESPLTPVITTDAVAGIDSNFNFVQNNGVILGPAVASVPEPSSALLCGMGVLGVLGFHRRSRLFRAGAMILIPMLLFAMSLRIMASDHGDTAENFNRIGADMTDVFIFPSPMNDENVVLVMDVHGLIPAGQSASFDPGVLYQFKIDTTGDIVEDLVIQAKFFGTGATQQVAIAGPMKPLTTGTTAIYGRRNPVLGTINEIFQPDPQAQHNLTVFAGTRADPFFFDLEAFYAIFPDRMTPLTGTVKSIPNPNAPQAGGFRPAGQAQDFLADLNVLSIVVELPRASLGGGIIRLWETTSLLSSTDFKYHQQDRLARPAVNEVLATVSNLRHHVNNTDNPTDDSGQLKNDIQSFLTFPAGRSTAIKNAIEAVLVPDVMIADLSQMGDAAYLGVETQGLSGSKFGGRALTDDVVDIDLMAIFGPLIPHLSALNPHLFGGVIPDDGNELPPFETDNVGAGGKLFLNTFPYLGVPH